MSDGCIKFSRCQWIVATLSRVYGSIESFHETTREAEGKISYIDFSVSPVSRNALEMYPKCICSRTQRSIEPTTSYHGGVTIDSWQCVYVLSFACTRR